MMTSCACVIQVSPFLSTPFVTPESTQFAEYMSICRTEVPGVKIPTDAECTTMVIMRDGVVYGGVTLRSYKHDFKFNRGPLETKLLVEIVILAVASDEKRRGYGRKLMAAVRRASNLQAATLQLEHIFYLVQADRNALEFWNKGAGFDANKKATSLAKSLAKSSPGKHVIYNHATPMCLEVRTMTHPASKSAQVLRSNVPACM